MAAARATRRLADFKVVPMAGRLPVGPLRAAVGASQRRLHRHAQVACSLQQVRSPWERPAPRTLAGDGAHALGARRWYKIKLPADLEREKAAEARTRKGREEQARRDKARAARLAKVDFGAEAATLMRKLAGGMESMRAANPGMRVNVLDGEEGGIEVDAGEYGTYSVRAEPEQRRVVYSQPTGEAFFYEYEPDVADWVSPDDGHSLREHFARDLMRCEYRGCCCCCQCACARSPEPTCC